MVIKRIELSFYWHENIFAKRQIHMTEQKQIMLRQQRELISFSSVIPVSDFCFSAIFSLSISWTINVIHTHRSQWHLHRCHKKKMYVRVLHCRFASETLSFWCSCETQWFNHPILFVWIFKSFKTMCINMY